MLYDPRWEKTETKADPFSLESLVAWLETKPADQKYEFCKYNNCLLAQWLQSIDPTARVDPEDGFVYHALGTRLYLYEGPWPEIAHAGGSMRFHLHTFGAALKRAREFLKPSEVRSDG